MRLLFFAPYVTAAAGITGAAISVDALCAALARRGCSAAILTDLGDLPAADDAPVVAEEQDEHVVLRARDPFAALALVLREMPLDAVAFCSTPGLQRALTTCHAARVAAVVTFVDPDLAALNATLVENPATLYLAESRFLAAHVAAWYGITAQRLCPIIDPARVRAAGPHDRVLFVNPIRAKGWEIAATVAERLPGVAFTILESWALEPSWRARCRARIATLANCQWHDATHDMRPIWANTRLLLMPSVWEEAWGRCASEAQVNGLPVVASNRGGLPETVGAGGVILDVHAPIADWAEAVSRLMGDAGHYEAVAYAARLHAARTEIQPDAVADRFLRLVSEHVERYRQRIGS
jgi:glycosyltransferase involved in cell wall biosynthesis